MSIEIKVPALGESVTSATLSRWLKEEGAMVKEGDALCEVESDKASVEVPATSSGVIHLVAKEGEELKIGALLATISTGASVIASSTASVATSTVTPSSGSTAAVKSTAPTASVATSTATSAEIKTVVIPALGESVTSATLSRWSKPSGSAIKEGEILCEVESDKASVEVPSPYSGVLEHLVKEGTEHPVGTAVAKISVGATSSSSVSVSASSSTSPVSSNSAVVSSVTSSEEINHASPAARKILSEAALEASSVKGSGRDGRITKEDAINATSTRPSISTPASSPVSASASAVSSVSSLVDASEVKIEKMSRLRKTIATRLVEAKNTTAMLTTFNEVDMLQSMDLRKKYKDSFKEKYGVNLGFMSLFSKACTMAIKDFPAINAQIHGEDVHYFKHVNLGVAVSTPKGLVVPVVRKAEGLELHQIEAEILRLAGKARDGKISIEDMQGGTFTITNGGVFGSMLSTPILNTPQSAILGMHNIVERPIAINGQVVIRPIMYVALSYDHRIVDGRESVGLLKKVKEYIEDPSRLLLGV